MNATFFDPAALYCTRCLAHENASATTCRGATHDFVVDGAVLQAAERLVQAGTLDAIADILLLYASDPVEDLVARLRGIADRKRQAS